MNSPSRPPSGFRLPLGLAALLCACATAGAQQPNLNSHEVNPDQSVTFRCYAPAAQKVTVTLDYDHHEIAMARGTDGVWSLTTGPLRPELHMYAFAVDGTAIMDPLNPSVDTGLIFRTNTVWVSGAPQPWDLADVPHGVVHHHVYHSAAIAGLPNGAEDYYVYTPPGYDGAGTTRYPVLYLLHGWSAVADAWITGGQANRIMDNLIAQGRAVPMVVVMPLGYGDWGFVAGGFSQLKDESNLSNNLNRFSTALLKEIIPLVESAYRVSTTRDDRAIAGLSMGGGQSLVIGLNHPHMFGWVGSFSGAVLYSDYSGPLPNLGDNGPLPRLLWVSCGTGDSLIADNRRFVAWLKSKGVQPTAVETPGIHNWPVWRDNLVAFAPLLFKPAPAH
jgi:enterochelin esterase family protein